MENKNGSVQATENNALHNAANIEKYLIGATYPLEKKQILDLVKKNSAPKNVIDTLEKLKDLKYHNNGEITNSICN